MATKIMTLEQAQSDMKELQHEQQHVGQWISEAGAVGNGKEVAKLIARSDELPYLIQGARLTILHYEIEQLKVERAEALNQVQGISEAVERAAAILKEAHEKHAAAQNELFAIRQDATSAQMTIGEKERERDGIIGGMMRATAPVVRSLPHMQRKAS